MSRILIDSELSRMKNFMRKLMIETQFSQMFFNIPLLNKLIKDDSWAKILEYERLKRVVPIVEKYVEKEKLTDETFVPHVFALLGYQQEAMIEKNKFECSDLGQHFASVGLGACETEDWGHDPNCQHYREFALNAFKKTLTEEDKIKLICGAFF